PFRSTYDEGEAHDAVRPHRERGRVDEKTVGSPPAQIELGQVRVLGVRRRRDILLNEWRFFGGAGEGPFLLATRRDVTRGFGWPVRASEQQHERPHRPPPGGRASAAARHVWYTCARVAGYEAVPSGCILIP